MATCRNCRQLIRRGGGDACPLCGHPLRAAADPGSGKPLRMDWSSTFVLMGLGGLTLAGIGHMARSGRFETFGWLVCGVAVVGYEWRAERFEYLRALRRHRTQLKRRPEK